MARTLPKPVPLRQRFSRGTATPARRSRPNRQESPMRAVHPETTTRDNLLAFRITGKVTKEDMHHMAEMANAAFDRFETEAALYSPAMEARVPLAAARSTGRPSCASNISKRSRLPSAVPITSPEAGARATPLRWSVWIESNRASATR